MVIRLESPEFDRICARLEEIALLLGRSADHGPAQPAGRSRIAPAPDAKDGALMDVKTLSRRTGLSTYTIYRMTSLRRIPHLKLGSRILFDPMAVQAWLDGCAVDPIGGLGEKLPTRPDST